MGRSGVLYLLERSFRLDGTDTLCMLESKRVRAAASFAQIHVEDADTRPKLCQEDIMIA